MAACATSRTWPTDPAAPVRSGLATVCTLSITTTTGLTARIAASILEKSVSASRWMPGAATPSRSARRRTWTRDSSPDTYNTGTPREPNLSSAISNSVDLPTPGSPPSNTSEPATRPPPSTESSSPICERIRTSPPRSVDTSDSGTTRGGSTAAAGSRAWTSSTSVFQPLHCGQRPIHREEAAAHCWQTYETLGFAIPPT
jgi:hypothetical protein